MSNIFLVIDLYFKNISASVSYGTATPALLYGSSRGTEF